MTVERAIILMLLIVIVALLVGGASIEVAGSCLVMGLLFGLLIGVTIRFDQPDRTASKL